ncbi:MAG TPA: hypothetical protein VGI75_09955 [Pirellulales bacterium]|jgi:TM2 domain-containing membrane protein YozV
MNGPGSGGNVIAALCSFLYPGLGQLVQGRLLAAAIQFLISIPLWFFWMGWVMHLYSAYDAAVYVPPLRELR